MTRKELLRPLLLSLLYAFLILGFYGDVSSAASGCGDLRERYEYVMDGAGLFRGNILESPRYAGVSVQTRQKIALDMVMESNTASAALKDAVRPKAGFFSGTADHLELRGEMGKMGEAARLRDACEYLTRSFNSAGAGDGQVRLQTILSLHHNPMSDMGTIEILLPLTRGLRAVNPWDARVAGKAVIEIFSRVRAGETSAYVTDVNRPIIRTQIDFHDLVQSPIVAFERIGEGAGVNASFFVTFNYHGQHIRTVYKPFTGETTWAKENINIYKVKFTRELQAFDFLARYFATDLIRVPDLAEVIIKHQGTTYGVGSLQVVFEGFTSLNAKYSPYGRPAQGWQEFGEVWKFQAQDRRWDVLAPYTRGVDYILGNKDRFPTSHFGSGSLSATGNPNNILIKELGDGKLMVVLIDNAKGRDPRDPRPLTMVDCPSAFELPREFVQRLMRLGDRDFTEMHERYRDLLTEDAINDGIVRIQNMQNMVKESGIDWSMILYFIQPASRTLDPCLEGRQDTLKKAA